MSTGTNKERLEQNNLKLEDIKTQIQNLPEASASSGGVKLFSTIEEMQADTTAKEGDLAVVYRSEIQNATVDSQFQIATFQDTVVLDTAVTDPIDLTYKAVDSSAMFEMSAGMGRLDSIMFHMTCKVGSSYIGIEYMSSDGITYTRGDTTGNPVDFGTEICYAHPEKWNDIIGKFIQIGGSTFEGLFRYSDGSWVLTPTQLTATPDYVCEKEFYGKNGIETGTMPNNGALNYNPSTSVQTIPAGYTSGGTISVVDASIDENIIPENIKSGVTILGVTGTYTGESSEMPEIDSITFTGNTSFTEGTDEVKAGATLGTFIVTGGTAPYSYSFGVDTSGTASKDNDKFALSGNSLLVGSTALTYSNRPTDGVYQTRVVVTDSNSKTKTIDLEIMVTRSGDIGGGDRGDRGDEY